MLNQSIVVGRLVEEPITKEKEGMKVTTIKIAVPRSFKNEEGIYDTDFIKCTLYEGIATNVKEYCRKGDVLRVKGRLECLSNEELRLIAEKVTFLSSGKKVEEE